MWEPSGEDFRKRVDESLLKFNGAQATTSG